MGKLIDAKELFEIRKFINAKDLDSIRKYVGAEEYARNISYSLMENIVTAIDESGFNIADSSTIEDLTFINMALKATLDRQLGVDNEFYHHIGKMIQTMKSEIK
jgi:hypothetical protein